MEALSAMPAVQVFGLACKNNTIMRVTTYLFSPAASSYIALQIAGSGRWAEICPQVS